MWGRSGSLSLTLAKAANAGAVVRGGGEREDFLVAGGGGECAERAANFDEDRLLRSEADVLNSPKPL